MLSYKQVEALVEFLDYALIDPDWVAQHVVVSMDDTVPKVTLHVWDPDEQDYKELREVFDEDTPD